MRSRTTTSQELTITRVTTRKSSDIEPLMEKSSERKRLNGDGDIERCPRLLFDDASSPLCMTMF
jgi:hypothetical protein